MAFPLTPAARHSVAIAGLSILTATIFGQTVNYQFIGLDDPFYVSKNPHIRDHLSWDVIRWNLTDIVVNNWHPLTMLSNAFVAAAFGTGPTPQHVANVVLHALNGVLLYLVLWRFTGRWWPSVFVAAVFALHPLRVESVAWISDRKGVLCGFFVLLTLLAYERFARRRTATTYACTLLLFAAALLSKPTAVALPFALLLLDYWPLERFRVDGETTRRHVASLVLEKVPLFALSAANSVITYVVQRDTGAVQNVERYSLGVRVANAIVSYVMYVADTLVPYHLAPQYPHPGDEIFGPLLYASGAVFVLVTVAAAFAWQRAPWFTVGWFWFCGMLVPAIGVVQVAHQARADRYTYLPQIGLLIAIAWGLDAACRRIPKAKTAIVASAAIWAVALSAAAFTQTRLWRDDFTLFSYTVERAPASSQARYFLGAEYLRRGDLDDAEAQFRAAIQCKLLLPEAFSNLGAIELHRGEVAIAADHFANAVQLEPKNPEWIVNYGVALLRLGQRVEAEALAERALAVKPDHARALELRTACQAARKS